MNSGLLFSTLAGGALRTRYNTLRMSTPLIERCHLSYGVSTRSDIVYSQRTLLLFIFVWQKGAPAGFSSQIWLKAFYRVENKGIGTPPGTVSTVIGGILGQSSSP